MHALYHETNREGFRKIMQSGKLMTGADLDHWRIKTPKNCFYSYIKL